MEVNEEMDVCCWLGTQHNISLQRYNKFKGKGNGVNKHVVVRRYGQGTVVLEISWSRD